MESDFVKEKIFSQKKIRAEHSLVFSKTKSSKKKNVENSNPPKSTKTEPLEVQTQISQTQTDLTGNSLTENFSNLQDSLQKTQNIKSFLHTVLLQLSQKNFKFKIPIDIFETVEDDISDFKMLFDLTEPEEKVGEGESDDDLDGPPGPPPDCSAEETKLPNVIDELKYEKEDDTDAVSLEKIPKSVFGESIWNQDKLLKKSEKYYCNTISQEMLKHFKKVRKSEKKKKKEKKTKKRIVFLFDNEMSVKTSIVIKKIKSREKLLRDIRNTNVLKIERHDFERIFPLFKMIMKFLQKSGTSISTILQNKKSEISHFDQNDQFLINFLSIPFIVERIRCLNFYFLHKSMIDELKFDLNKFIFVSRKLKKSEEFKEFLAFVLNICNFLNKKSKFKAVQKEQLYFGINIRSLSNLVKLKSHINPKESLLDLVYRLICHKSPNILNFSSQLDPIRKIGGEKLEFKEENYRELKSEVMYMQQAIKTLKKNWNSLELDKKIIENEVKLFLEVFEESLLPKCNFQVIEIKKLFAKLHENFEEIGKLFGLEVEQMDDFFMDMKNFLDLFDQAKHRYESSRKFYKRFNQIKKSEEISKIFSSFNEKSRTITKRKISIYNSGRKRGPKKVKKVRKKRDKTFLTLLQENKGYKFFSIVDVQIDGKGSSNKRAKREVLILGDGVYFFSNDQESDYGANKKGELSKILLERLSVEKVEKSEAKKRWIIEMKASEKKITFFFSRNKEFKKFLEIFSQIQK